MVFYYTNSKVDSALEKISGNQKQHSNFHISHTLNLDVIIKLAEIVLALVFCLIVLYFCIKRINRNKIKRENVTKLIQYNHVLPKLHQQEKDKINSFENKYPTFINLSNPNVDVKGSAEKHLTTHIQHKPEPPKLHQQEKGKINSLEKDQATIIDLSNPDVDVKGFTEILGDPAVIDDVRLYLAFLKDQPSYVCYDGNTLANIKLRLVAHGLPISSELLLRIFISYHTSLGNSESEALNDLNAFRRHAVDKRMCQLQMVREGRRNFYS